MEIIPCTLPLLALQTSGYHDYSHIVHILCLNDLVLVPHNTLHGHQSLLDIQYNLYLLIYSYRYFSFNNAKRILYSTDAWFLRYNKLLYNKNHLLLTDTKI